MTTATANAKKRGGLGRGLMNMLSEASVNLSDLTQPAAEEKTAQLAVEKLTSGKYQPRQAFSQESLQELAESIRAQGIIQPIIVRAIDAQHYEIIAGERRWRAAQLAGLQEVPVIIRNVPDEAAIAMALIENIQREDLNALEEAQALQRLQQEFQLTQQQVAEAVGKSRVTITHLLRLLELPGEIKKYLQEGKLDRGHAKVLLSLTMLDQVQVARRIVEKNLSVRETERLVQQWQRSISTSPKVKKVELNIQALERQLSDTLGTTVAIQHGAKGTGKLVIHYRNIDILDGVLNRMKIREAVDA